MGSHHKLHILFILLGSMVYMLSSTTASATPNILGTYEGTVTTNEFNCGIGGFSPPNPPASPVSSTETRPTTLTISSQSGTSFSGTGFDVKSEGPVDIGSSRRSCAGQHINHAAYH